MLEHAKTICSLGSIGFTAFLLDETVDRIRATEKNGRLVRAAGTGGWYGRLVRAARWARGLTGDWELEEKATEKNGRLVRAARWARGLTGDWKLEERAAGDHQYWRGNCSIGRRLSVPIHRQ